MEQFQNMFNSTYTLGVIREEMASALFPVVIVLGLFILTGGFGNIMIILYYGIKEQTNPSFMFIVAMAVCDVMVCFISMPLEMIDVLEFYTFPNVVGCKILRFVNYFASCSSNNFLLAVAVDRYKKLCRPFGHQFSMKTSKMIVAFIFGLGLAFTWPNFVFYDIVDTNLTGFDDVKLTSSIIGHDCKTRDEFNCYVMIYHGVLALLFLLVTVSLVVIYYNVVKEMVNVKNFRKQMTATNKIIAKVNFESVYRKKDVNLKNKTTCTMNRPCAENIQSQAPKITLQNSLDISEKRENIENIPARKKSQGQEIHKNMIKYTLNGPCTGNSQSNIYVSALHASAIRIEKRNSPRRKTIKENEIHKRKFTTIAISVTVAFIVSFLPFLVLMALQTTSGMYKRLTGSELLAYQFFIRSWLLASVVNPVIYGFFNSQFRDFIKSLFTRNTPCRK